MTLETITRALGARKTGHYWMARCPAHDDRDPSLSISQDRSGKILVCCHAGCEQRDVIDALRSRGLWGGKVDGCAPSQCHHAADRPPPDDGKRTRAALRIWKASVPAGGALAETYLRSRGITIPPPPTLRFNSRLKHPTGGIWPAMVSLVTGGADSVPLAVHRTFLARDGKGKANLQPAKMMLGPCRGGVVRLAHADDSVMVGEGIETVLAAMQATGRPGWAALSTSGLKGLDLPPGAREVIILADGDEPGVEAAFAARRRWQREGHTVRIARAPWGRDFADLLLSEMSDTGGSE